MFEQIFDVGREGERFFPRSRRPHRGVAEPLQALLEIRRVAVAILGVLKGQAPALFADFELYDAPDGTKAGKVGFHKV